jgi:hypothetical protein
MSDHKTFPASIGLEKFISEMANELEIAPKNIQLAYRLSTEPKSTVPHRLATAENWDRMLGNVQEALAAESNKLPTKRRKVYVVITQAKKTESGGAVMGSKKVWSSPKLNDHWTDGLIASQEEDPACFKHRRSW